MISACKPTNIFMKKIYTYFLLIFASLTLTIPSFAQDAMNVMNKGTSISSTQLESLKNITFNDSQILIHLTDGSIIRHDFNQFDNILFGEYLISTPLADLSSENTNFNVYLSDKILTVESSAIIKSLKLVDLSGKSIKVSLSGSESNAVSVSVESLTAGMYVVLAETADGIKTGKIIIK